MHKALALTLAIITFSCTAAAQNPQQKPQPEDEVLRITTDLVQVDAVITDKSDQVIPDLKLSDFSLFENGKRQELQFVEYVGADSKPRVEGNVADARAESDVVRNLTATDLHRVYAFVVDDLTIPAEDMITVRSLLTDFVDKRMQEGDLVAIIRVVGGVGLLQQFTSEKPLLHRAIAQLTPSFHPYSAFDNLEGVDRVNPVALSGGGAGEVSSPSGSTAASNQTMPGSAMDSDVSLDGYTRGSRALMTLALAGNVIDSMRTLPGRKNMVLFSGGLPIFDSTQSTVSVDGAPISIQETHSLSSSVSYLIQQLTDRASRAGVVVNTMDVRGLKAQRGVSSFTDPGNEAKSGLGNFSAAGANAGRVPDYARLDNTGLDTITGHQGLEALSDATGGVSVINTNNFGEGIDRIVARSSYYILAYKPTEPFDGKFHKLQIKVSRPGAKVYTRVGYVARAEDAPAKSLTKEQTIIKAAMSPLAKRDVDVSGAFQYRFVPENHAVVDVNLRIDASKLDFKQDAEGKYQTALDIVGFVINRSGKTEGGFSQTLNASLTSDEYKRALSSGLGYTGQLDLVPGSYQLRVAVRETETGKLGTLSRYLEVPDMSKKRFTMSSVFLHAVDPGAGAKAQPTALTALRQISRKNDLRYSVVVYNPKLDKDKTQLTTRLIISRAGKIIFQGAVQAIDLRGADASQAVKVGQIGLSKLSTGHYVLTLEVTDALSDKKNQTLVRSIDFNIID